MYICTYGCIFACILVCMFTCVLYCFICFSETVNRSLFLSHIVVEELDSFLVPFSLYSVLDAEKHDILILLSANLNDAVERNLSYAIIFLEYEENIGKLHSYFREAFNHSATSSFAVK